MDVDSSLSMTNRKESFDDDPTVKLEWIVYTCNKTLFTIHIGEPTMVEQHICLNFEKDAYITSAI
jgi:hypothetical protein